MRYEYTDLELQELHRHLYKITAEVVRVCQLHRLRYFIIGGTAIGAYYWDGIIPWDDDIDIGMPRADYERFLRVAPDELSAGFWLQWPGSEPHTPFWFAKVREHGTRFCENQFKRVPMHQGIYVDVFPFDKIPRLRWAERLQYAAFGFVNACFIGKDVWQWRHCGTCQVDEPRERSWAACAVTRAVVTVCSKRFLYRTLRVIQTLFNGLPMPYCKNIMTQSDKLPCADLGHLRPVAFGPLTVAAPPDLKAYLLMHYGTIAKHLPKEQQVNHRPAELSFGEA